MTTPHESKREFGPKNPVVTSIFDFSAQALGEHKTWLEQNPPTIPVSQISGFTQFTAQSAPYVGATESTTSTTFADLTTVGPTLSGLSDGQYVVLFGSCAAASAGDEADMGVAVNGIVDPTQAAATLATAFTSMAMGALVKLSNGGNNTLTAKYLSLHGGTAQFGRRWLIALKFAS